MTKSTPNKLYLQSKQIENDIMGALNTYSKTQLLTTPNSAFATLMAATVAFNHQLWNAFEQCLDPDTICYNIDDTVYVTGRDAVMRYWRTSDPCAFELTNKMTWEPPTWPTSVEGIALWTHREHGHIQVPIRYKFQFHPSTFLLTSVWGERADKKDN